MRIEKLTLQNFRNIKQQSFQFNNAVNIIFGNNGQGKTSILEAIYILAITKSFRASSEKIILQYDKEYFESNGTFSSDSGSEISLRIFYSQKDGKNIFVNKNRISRFSEIIGTIPVILLSLDDLELIYGIPASRRKFLDILLSQVSPVYLQALQYYKRSLVHTNKLLMLINQGEESTDSLFPWKKQLVQYGSEIIRMRNECIKYINEEIGQYYKDIAQTHDEIRLVYQSNVLKGRDNLSLNDLNDYYAELQKQYLDTDLKRQNTYIGPHRDDIRFEKNGHLFKAHGSQGESKTFLIALKFVESEYLKQKIKENPIVLMDDIFGELDNGRIARLTSKVAQIGQTFITTTLRNKFDELGEKTTSFFNIHDGQWVQ